MAQLGADVDALDILSTKFRDASVQLQEIISQISSQVEGAWWQGTDADQFRANWQSDFKTQLTNVSASLEQTGTVVKQQSDAQRQTSSV